MAGCSTAFDAPVAISATVSGSDIILSWADTGDAGYQIWWSTTDPYFSPGDAGTSSELILGPFSPTVTWTGIGNAGDPATNYYYTVANLCGEAGPTGTLDYEAEFDFAIVPGT